MTSQGHTVTEIVMLSPPEQNTNNTGDFFKEEGFLYLCVINAVEPIAQCTMWGAKGKRIDFGGKVVHSKDTRRLDRHMNALGLNGRDLP